MPVTLALIKPEALKMGYAPAIEATIEAQKFSIVARAQVTLTPPQAAELYEEFAGTALFAAMCAAVTSGPLVALALDKADAQAAWSELIGPADPAVALTRPWTVLTYGFVNAYGGFLGLISFAFGFYSTQSSRRCVREWSFINST